MIKTLKFGIEIEVININRQELARAIHSVVGGYIIPDGRVLHVIDRRERLWKVVPDASLSGGQLSGEIVSPILGYYDIEELQSVVRSVRAAGGTTDYSTGVHLHVNGATFNPRQVVNLVKLVFKQEYLLEHALKIRPERRNHYCKPIDLAFMHRLEAHPPKTMQELSDAWYGYRNDNPNRYDSSRYSGLNLNSLFFRGSIEFRFFNGTLHAGEIKAYIQLVLAIAAKAMTSKTVSSKRRQLDLTGTKYDFRVFLVNSLGLSGDEFKTARLHLTKNLAGSAAWRGERRDRRPVTASEQVAAA